MTVMPLRPEPAPHLVGREEELRLLNGHARRCHTGAAAALVLGVDVLAYAPFTDILRQILRERGREPFEAAAPATAEGMTAPATTELARIRPELGGLSEGHPEFLAGD